MKLARPILILTLLLVTGLFLSIRYLISHPGTISNAHQKQIIIHRVTIRADIADTPELRMQGLSGRKSMPEDAGMLFVFPTTDYQSFWMKEMYFPLDFIWIHDTTVVDLSERILPPRDFTSTDLPILTPVKPVNYVLEVNAGTIQRLGVRRGDALVIK